MAHLLICPNCGNRTTSSGACACWASRSRSTPRVTCRRARRPTCSRPTTTTAACSSSSPPPSSLGLQSMSDRRRNVFILLVVAGLAIASVAVLMTHSVKRGLDLKGGVELVYQGRPTPQQPKVDSQAIDRAVEVIRKRVDAFGVSEPEIQRSGSDQIAVGLPGTKNAQRAVRQVGKVAQLQFYDWEADVLGPDLKPNPSDPNVTGGQSAGQAGGMPYYDAVVAASKRPPTTNGGRATTNGEYYLVHDKHGKIAQRGQEQQAPGQPPSASFQHFAAVLDGELVTVPYIDFQQNPDGIDGANGADIEGGFTIQSAQDLAKLLQIGALPIKLKLISQSQVSATLGKEALSQGVTAGLVGLGLVALFLLVFYRVLGLIAVAALALYALYFAALIELIPITLTLPGIAGLILTIGVAADANIVIFERVKEEIRAGASVQRGIVAGYKKGLTAIIDANVVTLMTAFILFILATAGVKGFALVLGIGTIVSLFTAVMATQAILGTLGRLPVLQSPAALGAAKRRRPIRFDFMGASRWFFSMSGVILLIGALAIGSKGLNFGIDFESGTRITTAVQRPATENDIRSVMASAGYGDAKIQKVSNKDLGKYVFQISTKTLQPDKVQQVRNALDQRYGVGNNFSNTSIGPTFGKTIARTAVIAIIASLLVISAYIALRFEWKYAVPVLIALMHDLLITSGVYSLTGREVTTSTVAALLTILGYSLYDTIIVFDRVRENVPRMPRAAFSQIVNRSMSEVLTRSLATSFCTLLPIVALLIFGGATLRDFAFALLVGVLSGAYSSIFIASPVLTHWKEREHVYVMRRRRVAEQLGGAVLAYAVAAAGAPVDVAPPEKKRRGRRITEPELPGQPVSRAEFDEMVREIQPEATTATATREEEDPDRGRKALDPTRDLSPDEVVMPSEPKRPKQKRPRNRRHGRSR